MRPLPLAAILVMVLTGCSTFVSVQRVLPPDITLPKNKSEFAFISRFDADSLPFDNDNKVDVFRMGHDAFVKGLDAGFDTSRLFHLALSDSIIRGVAATEPPASDLDKRLVSQLCSANGTDYLLTLDAYNLYFDQEVEVVKQEDGTKDRTAYYDLVAETYIAIYDDQGEVVDRFKDELRIPHDERSVVSGLLAVGPSMGKADKHAVQISEELGRKFVQKLYPMTVFEDRPFFYTKEFNPAFKAYKAGQWAEAERKLLPLTDAGKTETAGRAAYNMAVLCENLNRLDEMKYWYDQAKSKLGNKTPFLPVEEYFR